MYCCEGQVQRLEIEERGQWSCLSAEIISPKVDHLPFDQFLELYFGQRAL